MTLPLVMFFYFTGGLVWMCNYGIDVDYIVNLFKNRF